MMRAKLQVTSVDDKSSSDGQYKAFELFMSPVCGNKQFGPNGESEDNTFSRYSPSGSFRLYITNPNLFGKFKVGQKLYADFTEASE